MVTIWEGDHPIGQRALGSQGGLGSSQMEAHFGLGARTSVSRITVRWPGGVTQEWPGPIAADGTIEIAAR